MNCGAEHTMYQPGDANWRCPKCGAKADEPKPFIIEEPIESADPNCSKLHNEDYCLCSSCGFGGTGKKVAAMLMKLDH